MSGRRAGVAAGEFLLALLAALAPAGALLAQPPPDWGTDPEDVWPGPGGDSGDRRRLAWSLPETPPEVVAVHRSVRALGVASRQGPLTLVPPGGRASRLTVTPWDPSARPMEQPLPARSRLLSVRGAPRGWWLLLGTSRRQRLVPPGGRASRLTVTPWDPSARPMEQPLPVRGRLLSVRGAPRGWWLLLGTSRRQHVVLHWPAADAPPRRLVGPHVLAGSTPSRMLALPDGRIVLSDDEAGRLFCVEDDQVRRSRPLGAPVHRLALAREAGLLLVALGEDEVVALDPETGRERWRWQSPEPLFWNLLAGPSLLWATSTEGTLTGLDLRTGRPRFTRRAGPQHILPALGPRPPGFGVAPASLAARVLSSRFPTVPWQALGPEQTLLLAWPDGTLEAYGADGERRWHVPPRSEGLPPQAVLTDPRGRLLVLWADGTLSLHGPDGGQRWQVRPPRLLEVRPPFELLGGPDGWLAVAGRRGGLVTLRFPEAPRGPAR